MPHSLSSNFDFLGKHDEQLVRLGALAEKYLADEVDPNTCLLKLRQNEEGWLCGSGSMILHPVDKQ